MKGLGLLGFFRWAIVICAAGVLIFQAQADKPSLGSEMSAAEFARCGLHKLTATELAALESWIDRHGTLQRPIVPHSPPRLEARKETSSDASSSVMVSFNTSTRKYHCPSCRGARQCTRNCISISKAEAIERGGVACQICGGGCD